MILRGKDSKYHASEHRGPRRVDRESSAFFRFVEQNHAVIGCLEDTLLNHLSADGFTLKLNGFGKFSVRHRPGIRRKIGFSGQTIQTKALRKVKFVSLGSLRQRERVD